MAWTIESVRVLLRRKKKEPMGQVLPMVLRVERGIGWLIEKKLNRGHFYLTHPHSKNSFEGDVQDTVPIPRSVLEKRTRT